MYPSIHASIHMCVSVQIHAHIDATPRSQKDQHPLFAAALILVSAIGPTANRMPDDNFAALREAGMRTLSKTSALYPKLKRSLQLHPDTLLRGEVRDSRDEHTAKYPIVLAPRQRLVLAFREAQIQVSDLFSLEVNCT